AGSTWIRWKEESKCRPSTLQDYRAELGHLYAAFGEGTPLNSISTETIEAWKRHAIADGRLSDRTINKRLQQLSAIFRYAQRSYGHPSNPVADVDRQPERRSGDFDVLDPDEVELLAANAASEQDAAIFTVAAFTGLRLGELLALRWGDVDWTLHLVHVRRSFTRGTESPPKSGRVRSVPLVDQAAAALDALSRRERWTGDDDLVFVNAVGDHVERSTLRRRYVAALKRAGLKRLRFHDLRHTFGTLAVQAFPLTDVKAYMGHADIATTMIYVHHVPQHDAASRLTELLSERAEGGIGCTAGASPPAPNQPSASEPAHQQGFSRLRNPARTWRPRTSSPGRAVPAGVGRSATWLIHAPAARSGNHPALQSGAVSHSAFARRLHRRPRSGCGLTSGGHLSVSVAALSCGPVAQLEAQQQATGTPTGRRRKAHCGR
ncbi:MAG: tyrosine-type recombinase/integrase, partial [Solirubrobacterales bacterium]